MRMIALILFMFLSVNAYAETVRVKSNDTYYSYEITPMGIGEAVEKKLDDEAAPKSNVQYQTYMSNPDWETPPKGEVIMQTCSENEPWSDWFKTNETDAKKYTQDRLDSEGWKIATAPANSTHHTIVDERPCFYDQTDHP